MCILLRIYKKSWTPRDYKDRVLDSTGVLRKKVGLYGIPKKLDLTAKQKHASFNLTTHRIVFYNGVVVNGVSVFW